MRGLCAALLAVTLLAGCGSVEAVPEPAPAPPPLALGVTEGNPALLTPGPTPAPFVAARDARAALRPRSVRVLVDWEKLQPRGDAPPRFDLPADGCMRGVAPCAPFSGLRDVFRALAARGWQPVVVVYGTPAWAARTPEAAAPGGACTVSSRAREPDPAAYRALVRALREEARADGAPIRAWAPWNEPNHPAFLAPQRAGCDPSAPSLASAAYTRIVRAFLAERRPGDRLLLGEAAGYDTPRPSASTAVELVAGLPRDVVCATDVWAQHVYVAQPAGGEAPSARGAPLAGDADTAGSPALLRAVERALDARGCSRRHTLWLTETGVGGPRPGRERPTDAASLTRACTAMREALASWRRDGRIAAAFQYSFREDPAFPVGLADPGLTRLYAPYAAWQGASCRASASG